jgi:outer membrane receptor for ferric coprogen and ferric-rhodotorulic acid
MISSVPSIRRLPRRALCSTSVCITPAERALNVALRQALVGMALAAGVLPLAAQTVSVPAASATDEAQRSENQTLPAVTVRARKTEGQSATVGKGDLSLKEIPQSVTVISQERIEQQSLKTLDDVMQQATGVTSEQLWLNNNYYSRGLKILNIRYDGGATSLITDRNNNADLAQFEEVSILRGADGLFGAGDAGGVINLKSKRPKDVAGVTALISGGSWNNYRAELDVTGPLNDSKTLKGRAVAVLQDQDHFFEPSHSRREVIYGALQAELSPSTSLFAGASLQKDRQDAFNASLPRYVDGADAHFPRSTTMGADWGWLERKNVALFAGLTQIINPAWKLNVNVRHTDGDDAINGAEMEGAISYTTRQSDWWRYQDATRARETLLDANLQGSFEAFGQAHDVIVGVDQNESVKHYKQNWVYYGAGDAFDRVPPPEWAYPPSSWDSSTRNESRASAIYGSLRLRPTDRLSLIAGGRKVFRDTQSILNRNTGVDNDFKQKNDFVPYYSAIYELTRKTSAYVSRAEIYQSQMNYFETGDGPSLKPATGSNVELGLKSELMDGRLLASVAYFDISKKNEAVYQSWSPTGSNAWCCYVAAGDKSSQGLDVELTGRLLPQWSIAFGYTYNKNENRRDDDEAFSTITPRHLLKLWSNHDLGAQISGLSLGWGVNAQSKTYQSGSVRAYNPVSGEFDGDWQDYQFLQKPYAVWSARAAYEINPTWSLSLNVKNLFDKVYYSTVGTSTGYGHFYGEPRSFMLTLKAKY